jgi:methionyl-tRNA formyltransferase
MTDIQIHNLVRGMNGPFPHAFTFKGNEKIEIDQTVLLKEDIKGVSGRVPLKRSEGVVVLCRNRGILVKEISVKGEKVNPGKVFNIGEILT